MAIEQPGSGTMVAGDQPAFADLEFATPALRDLVRSPWRMTCGSSADEMPGVIAPDAHVEFVFQTGSPCTTLRSGGTSPQPSPRAMIYAQRHGTLTLRSTGANTILAFRATPAVASVILGRPLVDCWDRAVDLADLVGPGAHQLLERIADAPDTCQDALVESWLTSRLVEWGSENDRNLRLQRALIWRSGEESVSALADRVGVTSRTLRRHFARHAGLSPKQLSMSGRVLRACACLGDYPEVPIAEVALRLGFNDQAAFTNAFRHYVGMTPARLRAEPIVYCERPGA
ncbi:MAG: helix-turn-helix domain-containing protein [Allosphingosinicella sp.]